MFKVNTGNRKLGNIVAINMPAIITCRENAPCTKLCYANKGTYRYPAVKNCYLENLRAYKEEPKKAELDILKQLPLIGYCRIHASGDIVDKDYLHMLVRIAIKAENVRFMMFTKKYELINEYLDTYKAFPENMKVIFSLWDGLKIDNPYDLPIACVALKGVKDDRIKPTAIPCAGKCDKCFACWDVKAGQQIIFEQH